jgi:hypothetical protein
MIDIQESQGSFTGSGNWLTCKGSRVRSEGQTTDWHARRPGLIHRVRQLTNIQENQCSVRCQAAHWHTRELMRCQPADWHTRKPVFSTVYSTGSGSWLTYKRASVG